MARSRKTLMPRYGFLVTKFRGSPVRAFHGLCQGTVPCVSRVMTLSVIRWYASFFTDTLLQPSTRVNGLLLVGELSQKAQTARCLLREKSGRLDREEKGNLSQSERGC